MEDRYLFKAKRISDGEWVVGYIARYGHTGKEKYYMIPSYASDLYSFLIDKNTICQCTGLKDKNGKLIWENDIVGLYNENKEKRYAVGSVEYGTFNCSCCEGVYGWYFDSADIRDSGRYEVIGNIFDNPELLESEE